MLYVLVMKDPPGYDSFLMKQIMKQNLGLGSGVFCCEILRQELL